ncbi:unnamed protein product [Arctia plantaginis]|uniref:Uncharacterized protein n=1 Tax=Arctia plantaginis TaxID=874455 RepID=A0A8S0YT26_ARCPL|nr:unnamed protein product [Arctia plantaginis]CAB3255708.1 unnamed protein product [Arctia plantaginis]
MLTKSPKPAYKRFITFSLKAVLLVEAAGLAVSYGLWHKLNSDRDFRLYMYKNYNWALEGYYGVGEKLANNKTRELDQAVWRNEGKI